MAKNYKVHTCVVCDLARKEQTGKSILVGVYNKTMRVPHLPFKLPTFTVWLLLESYKKGEKNFILCIERPSGTPLISIEGEMEFSHNKQIIDVPFEIPNFPLDEEGFYTIKFGLDSEIKTIDKFELLKRKEK